MKLCTNCHEPLPQMIGNNRGQWEGYRDGTRRFCKRVCQIQFGKLSQEDQKAAHYEWVREEALANSQSDWVS